jgi:hypothetical protein
VVTKMSKKSSLTLYGCLNFSRGKRLYIYIYTYIQYIYTVYGIMKYVRKKWYCVLAIRSVEVGKN